MTRRSNHTHLLERLKRLILRRRPGNTGASMTPTNDILLVVDVQNGFVNDSSAHVVQPIASFLEQWLDAGKPAVLTRFINTDGSQWERLIHWSRLKHSPEIDLRPELSEVVERHAGATIADKNTYSSLTPQVRQILEEHQVRRVLICGIATDGCVLKSAVDLFEDGYVPVVLSDLSSSHAGQEVHESGLLLISRFIGRDQVVESSSLQ